jgi:hypothetical protein
MYVLLLPTVGELVREGIRQNFEIISRPRIYFRAYLAFDGTE